MVYMYIVTQDCISIFAIEINNCNIIKINMPTRNGHNMHAGSMNVVSIVLALLTFTGNL